MNLRKPLSISTRLKEKSSFCTHVKRRRLQRHLASEVALAARATITRTAAAVIRTALQASGAVPMKSLTTKRKGLDTGVRIRLTKSGTRSTSTKSRALTTPAAGQTVTTTVKDRTAGGFWIKKKLRKRAFS